MAGSITGAVIKKNLSSSEVVLSEKYLDFLDVFDKA